MMICVSMMRMQVWMDIDVDAARVYALELYPDVCMRCVCFSVWCCGPFCFCLPAGQPSLSTCNHTLFHILTNCITYIQISMGLIRIVEFGMYVACKVPYLHIQLYCDGIVVSCIGTCVGIGMCCRSLCRRCSSPARSQNRSLSTISTSYCDPGHTQHTHPSSTLISLYLFITL